MTGVKERCAKEGIILSEKEMKVFDVPIGKDVAIALSIIKECYRQRKIKQFLQHPIPPDLEDNTDIIDDILKMMADKTQSLASTLEKEYPKNSHFEMCAYITSLKGDSKKGGLFSKRNLFIGGGAIVICVIAFLVYWFLHKKRALPEA